MQTSIYETDKPAVQDSLDFQQRLLPMRQRIYKLAYRNLRNREDAEDITQETFVRAWTHSARFDPSRSFDAWVARIAINLCLDTARQRPTARKTRRYACWTRKWTRPCNGRSIPCPLPIVAVFSCWNRSIPIKRSALS
jgi:DNA-directed RNA polymerase specialized sigma24 family protein